MTKKIEDGGPAFQTFRQHALGSVEEVNPGMSLRDWFAGQALAGMLASETDGSMYREEIAADRAFRIADVMLAARKTGEA